MSIVLTTARRICPCCGRPPNAGELNVNVVSRSISRAGRTVFFPTYQMKVAAPLVASIGGVAFFEDLLEAIWGDDPTGGPNNPANYFRVVLDHGVRAKLARLGVSVKSRWGAGYEVALGEMPALSGRNAMRGAA